MPETGIPTRQQVADMLRERRIGSLPQRPTIPQLPALPQVERAATSEAGLDRAMAALGLGIPEPTQGGVMGALGRALGAIDMPRAFVASTIQEVVDMFQGEGFSTSDLVQQARDHHGFGDVIADMNLDFGLGGWGNRIVGFVGDVATDPLMWAGGLGAFARASGAKGLVSDVAMRRKELQSLVKAGKATSKQSTELNALNDAVSAAGKYRTVSSARNALMKHGEVGQQLVKDLGIETGLRFRVPGTGPVLGSLSRGSNWVAKRRAGQIPQMVADRVKRELPEGTTLQDLVKLQMRGKPLSSELGEDIRQVVARAAKVPVDTLPFGTFPIAAGVTARIMGSPGVGFEKVATSKIGESFKRFLVDDQKQVLNRFRRSENPDVVILGNLFRNGFNRGAASAGLWSDLAHRHRQGFLNIVRKQYGITDDNLIGAITAEIPEELADDILAGRPLSRAAQQALDQFAGYDPKVIANVKRLHTELVLEKDLEFLLRPDLWADDAAFREAVEETLMRFGTYTPHIYSKKGLEISRLMKDGGLSEEQRDLLPFLKELLEDAEQPIRAAGEGDFAYRVGSRHLRSRAWVPEHVGVGGEGVAGGKHKIPIKGADWSTDDGWYEFALRRPYKHSEGTRGPSRGGRTPFEETPLTDAERAWRTAMGGDHMGRSVQRQVDDAMRAAGWLDEGESMWARGFLERERGYISSMTREIRLRAIETHAARQGILFSGADADLRKMLEIMESRGRLINLMMLRLSDDEQAHILARDAIYKDVGSTPGQGVSAEEIARGLGMDIEDARHLSERLASTQQELANAGVEVQSLESELLRLVGEADALLRGAGLLDESEGFEAVARWLDPAVALPDTPAAFTVDAVRQLMPMVDELDRALTRYTVLKEAANQVVRLREEILRSYGGKTTAGYQTGAAESVGRLLGGTERLAADLTAQFAYIDETVLPLLRERLGQAMNHDRSVQSAIQVMEAMLAAGANSIYPPTQAMRRMMQEFSRLFYPVEGMDLGMFGAYTPPAHWGLNPLLRRTLAESAHPNKKRIAELLDEIKAFRDDLFRRTGLDIEIGVETKLLESRLPRPGGRQALGEPLGVHPTVHLRGPKRPSKRHGAPPVGSGLSPEDAEKLTRLMEDYLMETVYYDAFRSGLQAGRPRSNALRFTISDEAINRARLEWSNPAKDVPLRTDVPARLSPDDFSALMDTYARLEASLNHRYLQGVLDDYSVVEARLFETLGMLESNAARLFGGLVETEAAGLASGGTLKWHWDETFMRDWFQSLREGKELTQFGRAAGAAEGPLPTVELGRIIQNIDEIWGTPAGQQGSLFAQYAMIEDLKVQVGRLQNALEGAEMHERAIAEILLKKKQLELAAMNDNLALQANAKRMFGPDNKKMFDLNSFGGSIDFDNLTVESVQNLLADTRQMWGAWRIAGNQEFADQVTEAMLAAQRMNDRKQVEGLLKAFDTVHNWMKAQMVATPGFVIRNVMGGMTNMWFAGIPLVETMKAGKLLQSAYRRGDGDLLRGARIMLDAKPSQELKNFVTVLEAGVHAGGQAASTVDSALMAKGRLDFLFGTKKTKEGARVGARINLDPTDAGFVMFSAVRHANTFAEEMLRVGTALHAMRTGSSLDDALDTVYRLHFNYGDLSKWEREVGRRVMPFYTWTRNNLPLQMEFVARYPRRFNQLVSLKRNLEHGEEREGVVPDYFMRPFGVQLPFSIGGATAYSVPDMPFQDLMRFDPTAEGAGRAVEQLVSGFTPMLKAPIEYWAGKQVFASIPYTGRFQKVPSTMSAVPGLMPILGSLGLAEKNSAGDWMMQDFRIGLVDNLLPYIGRLRRVLPSEERYQERYLQTLLSTLGGVNLRLNTPQMQENALLRREIEEGLRQRDLVDIETGRG